RSDAEAVNEVELRDTKVALDIKQPSSELATEPEPRETKVALGNERSDAEAVNEVELRDTKVALDIKQPSSELATEPEPRETKVSLSIENPDVEAVPEPESRKSQLALELEQSTPRLATDKEKKIILVSLVSLLAPLKDLKLSHAPIFFPLNKSRLLIGLGVAFMFASIFAVYTYINHRKSYSQAQGTLEYIKVLNTTEKYQECIQQAQTFPKHYSKLYAEVETLLHECQQGEAEGQLAAAKKLAEQSRLKDAIAIAAQVPEDMNVHSEAQQLISQWSERIFQIASNKYQEGNLKEAVAIAGAVPSDSPLAARAQAAIQQWNEEWKKNELHLQAAQKALDESRWQDAINTAKKISNTDYWQKQSEPIIQKAEAEIAAAQAAASRRKYKPRPKPAAKPAPTIVRPGVTNFKNIYIHPNHPINDPNRDWVKERLGRE
ncbi:MAG: hypothetical protein QNJ72_35540, partial [Pleurocapsa sp. MO_226.B13]|nr:hypothetical protein [Pleurocapsa sp. MO_226.B13]